MQKMKFKNSGIDWIGKIPEHWKIDRLKDQAQIITGNTPPKSNPENYQDGTIPWIKPDSLRGGEVEDSEEKLTELGLKSARLIPKNAILVGCIGDLGNYAISGCELTTNQQINSIIFNNSVEYRFGKYVIIASKSENWRLSTIVVVPILNKTRQGQIYLPLPLLPEQKAIADYLDKACEKIDRVIELKKKQLDKIDAYYKSRLHEAITKGLDESVSFKQSSISWQGEVPAHWKKEKLYRLSDKMGSGGTPKSSNQEYYDGEIPWIQSGDLNDGILTKTKKTITERGLNESSAKLFSKNTVLIAMYGATIGKLGKMGMDAATNQACCAIQISAKIDSDFLFYMLYNMREYLISQGYGGGQSNISQEVLKQQYFYFPEINEQREIVKFIIKLQNKSEAVKSNISAQLLTIQEYRKSLIHECVTGKKKIAEYVQS
jgi:type I restriction enzyme S subunit